MTLTNFYNIIGSGNKKKRDKTFKNHLIEPNSMILCIGGTGSGKSNALVNFLKLKNESFYEIIIFTGSTEDEPLYNFLRQKMPDIKFYTNIEELPELTEYDNENKNLEKLIVFDDFINLKKNEMKKINEYLTSGRKFGFTCFLMAQSYTSVPKIITRNVQYFIVFKLNDNTSINNIFRNHNIEGFDKEEFKELYLYATDEKLHFFIIDLKNKEYMLRKNFTEILI
ncbi:MAG: hypothetical protein RLZZ392_114 [Pseudomonadota bacterium]|jgi:hypothetical protein